MTTLQSLLTPAAVIDQKRMHDNITRMQQRMNTLGVRFRPHVKTSKCIPVTQAQIAAGAYGITVSTLKEAQYFFEQGITNILYAVGISPNKLPAVLALRRSGCNLKIITDNIPAAQHIVEFGKTHQEAFEVWIEIDTDGHRSGLKPDQSDLLDVARHIHEGGLILGGVMTHAGSSYDLNTPQALAAMAEQERSGCVHAAQRIRNAGMPCPVVSVGSTPTALSAEHLEGVTEVRAGVYVFFDLTMYNIGVCSMDNIAQSVLTTVIGHQPEKGWAIVDAGWMAMSRDRSTQKQSINFGYGQVCDANGQALLGYTLSGANQEHGIVSYTGKNEACKHIAEQFPVGTLLHILPNHACATGAQFPEYYALDINGNIANWPRIYGW